MRQHEWRALLTNAVQHNDSSQLDAIAARPADVTLAAQIMAADADQLKTIVSPA